MVVDNHRRYPIHMCYQCGYMEGQNIEIDNHMKISVIQTMNRMNENELALFLSQCDFKGATEQEIRAWLDKPLKKRSLRPRSAENVENFFRKMNQTAGNGI